MGEAKRQIAFPPPEENKKNVKHLSKAAEGGWGVGGRARHPRSTRPSPRNFLIRPCYLYVYIAQKIPVGLMHNFHNGDRHFFDTNTLLLPVIAHILQLGSPALQCHIWTSEDVHELKKV